MAVGWPAALQGREEPCAALAGKTLCSAMSGVGARRVSLTPGIVFDLSLTSPMIYFFNPPSCIFNSS